ncbi:hypothetical protein P4V72_29465 [Bacillus thuringiensis]|uniref:Uncharacterized protein n=2 Tax=Bacillus TaxID=1386 RepID=A0A9W3XKK0_BACTU|nr:hypothetical protein [Bacillus thuringiensis]AQY40975.1 hypothetical protein B4918_24760 [Bacillus thuringiensis]MDR4149439.1 hypothetical protein [Bacillus thuringiensis]MEC3575284.1 hypothetical protein [Bacillus thuringiensis]MED2021687.1 hypothetical protein [Bacillus thuringiensis]MED2145246.1 hypothetical protein [Bacillus thuringiensis]
MEKPRRTYRSNGMIVNVVGELNCKLFAEKFVEIVRKEILNGEIDLEKYKEIIKAEDLRDKKE